jgi:hypothetical protein
MIGAPRLLPLVFTQLYRGLSMAIIAVSLSVNGWRTVLFGRAVLWGL